jgi:hypothetical protein
MKRIVTIAAMLTLTSSIAFAFKPLLTVTIADLTHMPLLVNHTTSGNTVSFTILFQETGAFHNVWSPTLHQKDDKGKTIFCGGLATSVSMADDTVTEIQFKIKASSVTASTFSIHASTRDRKSVVYVFPLSVLFEHFKGHHEYGPLGIGAETNPVKEYFKKKRDPGPVFDKVDALWNNAEKMASKKPDARDGL